MAGHLCLKWNNHSSAFVHSISNIQTKEKYSDATIICQGQYFSVHRVVLSTCSEYFEEMFERIQCQHPYIVFKDIEPKEMELLLNYMYQGEVNVIQERLPNLIKAAEALKIKGLAVPDDIPSVKDSPKKRSPSNGDTPASKRRLEERKRKTDSLVTNQNNSEISEQQNKNTQSDMKFENVEEKSIKSEPEDFCFGDERIPDPSRENESSFNKEENAFANVSSDLKTESDATQVQQTDVPATNSGDYDDQPFFQSLSLGEFPNCSEEDISSSDIPNQDTICELKTESNQFSLESQQSAANFPSSSQAYTEEQQQLYDQAPQQETFAYAGTSFRCHICSYNCDSARHLKHHIKLYHSERKYFSCPFCRKVFITKQHIHRHILIHTGEKPYTCPRCLKGFRVKHHLTNHLNKKLQCVRSDFQREQQNLNPKALV